MKSFLGVVVNRGAKCLEIAAGAALVASRLHAGGAGLGIDLDQLFAAPEFVQPLDSGFDLKLLAYDLTDLQHAVATSLIYCMLK
jgi:hypothetical protein